jgi:hypothetical protein
MSGPHGYGTGSGAVTRVRRASRPGAQTDDAARGRHAGLAGGGSVRERSHRCVSEGRVEPFPHERSGTAGSPQASDGRPGDRSVASISLVSRYRSGWPGSAGSNGWKPRRSHHDGAASSIALTTTARHAARSWRSTVVAKSWATRVLGGDFSTVRRERPVCVRGRRRSRRTTSRRHRAVRDGRARGPTVRRRAPASWPWRPAVFGYGHVMSMGTTGSRGWPTSPHSAPQRVEQVRHGLDRQGAGCAMRCGHGT